MFVLCPHCQFLVGLESANGQPPEHCPRCHERLQPAVPVPEASAQGDPPPPSPAALTAPDHPSTAPAVDEPAVPPGTPGETGPTPDAAMAMDITPSIAPEQATASDATATTLSDAAPHASTIPAPLPVDAEIRPAAAAQPGSHRWSPTPTTRRRLQVASVPVLLLVLLMQCVLANRTQLAADAYWRPLVARVCSALSCTLPAWHEPAAFTLLDRTVRPDPLRPGVLHVAAGFRNDANWPQAWPSLALTLSDADGRVAGARVFAPNEYLAPMSTQETMASGQRAQVALDLVEPANHPVAFTFDFR
jgi:hypothetical protein